MLILSRSINSLLSDDPSTGQKPNIQILTFIFLMLNFLAATQDIAVDGWALTMLKRRNVGYASTCNTAGQTAGFFIGNVIFLALESADFCNKYIRSAGDQQATGLVTFQGFLYHSGIVFLIVTILVALFKGEKSSIATPVGHEASGGKVSPNDYDPEVLVRLTKRKTGGSDLEDDKPSEHEDDDERNLEKDLTVRETYNLLYKIIKLPSFRIFAVILLTCKIGFSAPDAVSGLKLVEAGVHKENLAMLAVPMVPLQIILPWVISRITCGPRPLDLLLKAYPFRLVFGLIFPLVVYWTPSFKSSDGTFPALYYLGLIIIYALHQITVYSIFVALMAFHAAVSDPSIGGTYMTLLNTITNLGGNWPSTLSLWLVDKLTVQNCTEVCRYNSTQSATVNPSINSTSDPVTTIAPGATTVASPAYSCQTDCSTLLDGYYIECAICVIFGFVWLQWGSGKLRRLQSLPPVSWSVSSGSNKSNR